MSILVEAGLAKTAGFIGIGESLLGLGEVICGFVWIGYDGYGGHGLWSGFTLIFAGILGIIIWQNRSMILMAFFFVICIILLAVLIVQAVLADRAYILWRSFQATSNCSVSYLGCQCINSEGEVIPIKLDSCDEISSIDTLFLTMTILSSIGTCLTFAGSVIACMGTCCADDEEPEVIVEQPAGPQPVVAYTTSRQYPPGQHTIQQHPRVLTASAGQ